MGRKDLNYSREAWKWGNWYSKDRTGDTFSYNNPTVDINKSVRNLSSAPAFLMKVMSDGSVANKFYKLWAETARQDLTKFAKDKLCFWYKGAKRSDSKKLPLRSKYKLYGKYAELFIWSYPTNYVFHVGRSNVPSKWIRFKKGEVRKPVKGSKGWFTPKKYKRDIKGMIEMGDVNFKGKPERFFTSKTSHEKTRKYGLPFVWYQTTDKKVLPLQLRMEVADRVMDAPELDSILHDAFMKAAEKFK